ncbi:hypothetical protein LCGC14_2658510 [marine sediment metagenome]|uniref:Uncharacterized protein n=1 Tax=marine sediment metagenome TaxID=412755 RepID=A0A0F8ZSM2_9ZZZZ
MSFIPESERKEYIGKHMTKFEYRLRWLLTKGFEILNHDPQKQLVLIRKRRKILFWTRKQVNIFLYLKHNVIKSIEEMVV